MIFLIPILFTSLLAFYGIYSLNHIPWSTDTLLYALPDYSVNCRLWGKGLLPLWNGYLGCGTPHLADWLSTSLYPPAFAWHLLGGDRRLVLLTLLHAAWALGGGFLWLRSQKASPGFAWLGALSFAGSAHFTRCWLAAPFAFTLSWVPWVFWSLHRSIEFPRSRWWVLSTAFLSLQILAGYPFFVFYTWVLLAAWFFFQRPSRLQWKSLLKILGLSLGLTCAQWIPFLEFLTYTVRGGWDHFPYFTRPVECLTLFHPLFAGDPSNFSYRGLPANGNFGNLYFGLIPFLLFVGGWFHARVLQIRFWNFAALFFFLWLLGPLFPLWRPLPEKTLEFFDPSKAVGLFLFCACTSLSLAGTRWMNDLKFPKTFRPWFWAAGALWTLDLLTLPFRLLHWVPNPYLNPTLEKTWQSFAPQAEGYRVLSLQSPSQWTFSRLEGYPLKNAGLLMMNSNAVWGIRSVNAYLSTATMTLHNLEKYFRRGFPFAGDLLDVAGVKYLMLPQAPPGGKYKAMGRIGGDSLFLNPGAAPRGWAVSGTQVFPDRPALLLALSRTHSGWAQKVFLEKGPDGEPIRLAEVAGSLPSPAHGTGMDFKAEIRQPGYWVFNETWAPGWHAWVDQKPSPILRAYGLFMAVPLPEKGTHQVDFRYEPASIRLGLFLSLASFAFFMAIFLEFISKPFSPRST